MTVQSVIEQKLAAGIHAKHMDVVNESSNHNVPPGSESPHRIARPAAGPTCRRS